MKDFKYILPIIIILFFISCNSKKDNMIEVSYEDVCISIPNNELSLYTSADIYNSIDSTIFFGYNHYFERFDLFDLTNRKFLKSINFEKEGPNGISNIETFGVINNLILIKEKFRIVTLKDSLISFSLRPDSSYHIKNGFNFDKHIIVPPSFGGLDVDSKGNIFFSIFINNNLPLAYVNMSSKLISLLPFKNPIENIKSYSFKMHPSIEVVDNDLLVVNYNFSSRIYTYNWQKDEITTFNIKSSFTNNETPPLTSEELQDTPTTINYHLNELNFFGVEYDKFRNIYLRVHQDKRETSSENQVLYLSIISSDFQKLKEIKLPNRTKPYFEIGKEGIYFPVEPSDESNLCFKLLKIEKTTR